MRAGPDQRSILFILPADLGTIGLQIGIDLFDYLRTLEDDQSAVSSPASSPPGRCGVSDPHRPQGPLRVLWSRRIRCRPHPPG